jgi:type VI protein secretion system component VasF
VSDWLDLELSHQLAPAEAPDELWERVRPAARPESPRRRAWAAWPIAAIVMVLIATGTLFLAAKGERPMPATRHLAVEQPRLHDPGCLTCHTNL